MWDTWRPDAKAVLRNKNVRSSLARYFAVMEGDKQAKFLIAKKLPACFNKKDSLLEIWNLHDSLTHEFYELEKEIDTKEKFLEDLPTPKSSFIDLLAFK